VGNLDLPEVVYMTVELLDFLRTGCILRKIQKMKLLIYDKQFKGNVNDVYHHFITTILMYNPQCHRWGKGAFILLENGTRVQNVSYGPDPGDFLAIIS
jgi:hypothetical protein